MLCMLMTLICLSETVNSAQGNARIFLQTSEVIGIHKTIGNSKYLRMSQSQNQVVTQFTQWIRFLYEKHVVNQSKIRHFLCNPTVHSMLTRTLQVSAMIKINQVCIITPLFF
jgi:hypothetical protein